MDSSPQSQPAPSTDLTVDISAASTGGGGSYPRQGGAITRMIGKLILRLMGWRVEGDWPAEDKLVIVGAPHTSNWDLPLSLGMQMSTNLRLNWMMKAEAFVWPLSGLFKRLGGIPIDRKAASDVVEQTKAVFDAREKMYLGITPTGTRSAKAGYRKGYLRIAYGAGVPVFIAGVDAPNKRLVLDRLWPLTGDIEADNDAIRDYVRANYQGMNAKRKSADQTREPG
ncbi:MAG: 1-acyl-sn-glycerol-3-phosphate acyltransferase [Pseudomonadota bacterium]